MRVAISGTHASGKSTLIEAFLLGHGDYLHEPEPYEALQDLYGEAFGAEPSSDDFYRQLEYQVERLNNYRVGDRVIFERSPVDFLAYLLALNDLGREQVDRALAERSIAMAKGAVALLDMIVYLPLTGGGVVAEFEDPELRRAVDTRLEGILLDDDFGLFVARGPSVVEAPGTTAQRLQTLDDALRSLATDPC